MLMFRFKQIIRKFIPINLLFPFVNFLRFFKILVTTNTLNIRDLEKLHDFKISQNRMDLNI